MATKYLDSTGVGILWGKTKDYANARKTEVMNLKGAANGFASLDANGKVPLSQLGNIDTTLLIIPADNKLPTTGIKTNKIYLIKENSETNNVYTEYIYVNNAWEILGKFAVKVDLSPYATTQSVNDKLANKVDKVTGKGLSTNDFTTALLTKLNGIEEGANKITVDDSLKYNSTNPVQNMVVTDAIDGLQVRMVNAETKVDNSVVSVTFGKTSGDAIWEIVKNDGTSTNGSFDVADENYAGMMSADDKVKLDRMSVEEGGSFSVGHVDGVLFQVPNEEGNNVAYEYKFLQGGQISTTDGSYDLPKESGRLALTSQIPDIAAITSTELADILK